MPSAVPLTAATGATMLAGPRAVSGSPATTACRSHAGAAEIYAGVGGMASRVTKRRGRSLDCEQQPIPLTFAICVPFRVGLFSLCLFWFFSKIHGHMIGFAALSAPAAYSVFQSLFVLLVLC